MHSQGGEEEALGGLLPHVGRFLDIGAYDGRMFSNTLALAERGWTGVCVEAAPTLVAALMVQHASRPEVEVVSAAVVAQRPGWETFWDTETDCVSTLDTVHRDLRPASTYTPLLLHTVSVGSLLNKVGHDFDFISIDTEGSSVEIAEALPLARLKRLKVICVERDSVPRLEGFELCWQDGNNLIFARK